MAAPTSFIYDLGREIDLDKARKAFSAFKSPPGEKNFAFARIDSLNAILFKNGKLRIAHSDGTKKSLEKALPTSIPKIQKLVEDVCKACGLKASAGEIISNGKAEEEPFQLERSSLGNSAGLLVLQATAVRAPEEVLGEYQRDRLSTQAGDTLGRSLADGAKDKKALAKSIAEFLKSQGVGVAEAFEGDKETVAKFIVRESAFSYCLPPTGKPACGFIRGLIRGAFAAFFKNESVSVTETRCWATGDVECEFSVRQLSM